MPSEISRIRKQQILDHFTGRGWFATADVRELAGMPKCLSPLLTQMVKAGDLIRDGWGRGTRYSTGADFHAVHNCPQCLQPMTWHSCPDCASPGYYREYGPSPDRCPTCAGRSGWYQCVHHD